MMAKILMAAFETHEAADHAITRLENQGYHRTDISVISKDNTSPDHATNSDDTGDTTKSPVAKGATTGAVAGGVIAGLTGLVVGGPIGAVLALLTEGAVTGGLAGGLIGGLTGAGVSRNLASKYDETIQADGVVIGLRGKESMIDSAQTILEDAGGQNVEVVHMRDESTVDQTAREHTSTTAQAPLTRHTEPAFGEKIDGNAADDSTGTTGNPTGRTTIDPVDR
jgi:Heat induced stress protein YflT